VPELLAPTHLIVLALVALLLFGPKRLPEIGRSLGTGIRGLRDGLSSSSTSDASQGESGTDRPASQQTHGRESAT
jgi:sec-independent protein translocase protein TatA